MDTENLTFEAAVLRLNEIVRLLENGNESLDNSMKLFEEGTALASYCYDELHTAEQKITQLTEGEGENQE